MKNLLVSSAFLLLSVQLFSQTYFETSWISNNVKYTGFVLFYSDEEALVRIKYNANGMDKVASYKCSYQEFTKTDGTKDRYLNGTEASIVKGDNGTTVTAQITFILRIQTTTIIRLIPLMTMD